ncbi:MAG TPA: chromosome segregation protein SMC, partial [Planctomycetaceae bacterium]|nr:chromosome segregation protein SMC [Planctomycetaceae bacterium]
MLKSLELYGFKSFADRTHFDFAAGITGVVGPNGSGKSNVVDALKWILGDQSAKSLRGTEMTDVIFNGSASRKPCNYTEAFLTIDNSQRFLAVDAAEITIGRRLYRSGDAEYLINRAPARLKDIRDLLLGTGAGNAAYCIIEQGRVDQILQANPTNRRIVFEEAAGVSRFKARRVEAQRKLERVAQNLQRLSDIVDEVEAQLNAVRGQAAKAIKYREVSEELKTWWLGLAADDYRAVSVELQAISARLAETTARLEELAEEQRSSDGAESEFERDLGEVEDRLREAERKAAQNREQIASQEASLKFQTARLTEMDAELARMRPQQSELLRRVTEAEAEHAAQHQLLADIEAESVRLHERLRSQDKQLQGSAARWEQARTHLEHARRQQQDTARRLATSEQAVAAIEVQQAGLEESLTRLTGRWDELQREQDDAEQHRNQLRQEYERWQQELDTAQSAQRIGAVRVQELSAQVQSKRDQLAELREARSAAIARRGILEDLELRQEGLGLGVKELLHRARHSDTSPWNTIVGSVSELLDVDLEHAGLLEVALGTRAQLLVLREYQPLLDYLAGGHATLTGRVGFVAVPDRAASQPWPDFRPQGRLVHLHVAQPPPLDLQGHPGVVARADQLVTSEHGIQGLAETLLTDTWIVETLDVAVQLASTFGRGARFVTRQGELLDETGSLQLGTVRSETSLLSRKSELRRLRNDLARQERELSLRETELQQAQTALATEDAALATAQAEVNRLSQLVSEALAVWRTADQSAEHLRREMEMISGQMQGSRDELDRLEQAHIETLARWETARQDMATHEAALTDAERVFGETSQANQQLEQQKAAEQIDLVKQAERLTTARLAIERLVSERTQRVAQAEELQRRVIAAEAQRQKLALQLLEARALVSEIYSSGDTLQNEVVRIQGEKAELRQRRSAFLDLEMRLRRERRAIQEQRHADEIRDRELRHTLGTLAERIHEEYQVSLEELAASDVSAWKLFQDERSKGARPAERDDEDAQ